MMNNINQQVEVFASEDIEARDKDQRAEVVRDFIIHLGAGRCSELDEYFKSEPHNLVLVEADPHLAEALKKRIEGKPNTCVISQAISGRSGSAAFYRYNQPDVNSLRQPDSKLIELFPGLKTIEEINVDTVDLPSLLKSFSLKTEGNSLLIIDLPGEESLVLEMLKESNQLYKFEEIQLNSSKDILFSKSQSGLHVINQIKSLGFDLIAERTNLDQNFIKWELKRNQLKVDKLNLKKQITGLVAENQGQKKSISDSDIKIEQLGLNNNEQTALISVTQEQLEVSKKKNIDQKKIVDELEEKLARIVTERDDKARQAAKFLSKFDDVGKLLVEKKDQLKKSLATIEQQNLTNQNLNSQLDEKENQLLDFHSVNDLHAKSLAERQAELDKQAHRELSEARDRGKQLESLEKELLNNKEELQSESKVFNDKLSELEVISENYKIKIIERDARIVVMESELHDAQVTVGLSTKLAMLRDSDLRELQERHKQSVLAQQEQQERLNQAEERLGLAERHLKALSEVSGTVRSNSSPRIRSSCGKAARKHRKKVKRK